MVAIASHPKFCGESVSSAKKGTDDDITNRQLVDRRRSPGSVHRNHHAARGAGGASRHESSHPGCVRSFPGLSDCRRGHLFQGALHPISRRQRRELRRTQELNPTGPWRLRHLSWGFAGDPLQGSPTPPLRGLSRAALRFPYLFVHAQYPGRWRQDAQEYGQGARRLTRPDRLVACQSDFSLPA